MLNRLRHAGCGGYDGVGATKKGSGRMPGTLNKWSRGESNPGPMTVPTVFYVRSPLAFQLLFCLHLYRGQPVAGLSTVQVPQTPCGSASEASLLNDARFLPGDAEERTERLLAGLVLARSSGSESELSAVRFSTYCFAGDIHERTPHSRHASLQRTGHRRNRSPPILSYQASGFSAGFFSIHPMALLAQIASSEHRPGTNEANEIAVT